jgi:hypothetical protein
VFHQLTNKGDARCKMMYCYGPAGDVAHWKQELAGTLPGRRGRAPLPAGAPQFRSAPKKPPSKGAVGLGSVPEKDTTEAGVTTMGIIMNGVTGRMGTNQHLLRSIVAIIASRAASRSPTRVIMPEPDPRRPQRAQAAQAGRTARRQVDHRPRRRAEGPGLRVYFDAQTTDRRVDASERPSPPASTSTARSRRR